MRCLSTTWLQNIVRLVNKNILYYGDVFIMCPLKGLTIMNAYHSHFPDFERDAFPSPTGVNYYQLITLGTTLTVASTSFRPQQGLTIMNHLQLLYLV